MDEHDSIFSCDPVVPWTQACASDHIPLGTNAFLVVVAQRRSGCSVRLSSMCHASMFSTDGLSN